MNVRPLKIAIDARVHPRNWGGVAHAAMGLIHALGKLDDGPEQYMLIVEWDEQQEWLERYIGRNQQFSRQPHPEDRPAAPPPQLGRLERGVQRVVQAGRRLQARLEPPPAPPPEVWRWPDLEVSDGYYESLGCSVIHFTSQRYVLCALPSIYNPHDLQHVHYPEFFTAREIARREIVYRGGCRHAETVAVGTQWIKEDIVRQYGTHPDKIQVIPWASPSLSYGEPTADHIASVRTKYKLPEHFALYPAIPWPHKNHGRLFEALARLRDERGLTVNLVCTGDYKQAFWADFWPALKAQIEGLRLESQVTFTGFVPDDDMRAFFRLARFLVLPSLFEADSCPIHEAWVEGLPVASSNASALPDQVLDAGLLFDPMDVSSIADAVAALATDARLAERLRVLGTARVADFDWERTARAYRAVYRRAARATLTEEDRWLLQWDWMRHPRRGSTGNPSPMNAPQRPAINASVASPVIS